ncbi:MAG TPA: DUF3035 domain-containing protein [Acetobacteraceae bacterium]|nr:DUF3035 domain-containing protein [Acetobacteraceae bacterium]
MTILRLAALAGVLGLAACSGDELTRTFGLTRDAPDEFTVTTRAPLSMPPDFTLRPPRPGATRPQELSQRQQAEAALVPDTVTASDQGVPTTAGQQALVQAAGRPAPADIRARVDSEAALDQPSRTFADRMLFWKAAPPPGTPVDPVRESQRLRQNAALGQSVDSGDTPIIQRRRAGLFSGLF